MYWQLQYEIENKIKKGHAFFGNLGKYFDTHGTCTKPVKPIISTYKRMQYLHMYVRIHLDNNAKNLKMFLEKNI